MYLFKVRKEKERFFADVNSLGLFTISILEDHSRHSSDMGVAGISLYHY